MQKLIDRVVGHIKSIRPPVSNPEESNINADRAELMLERAFYGDMTDINAIGERLQTVCKMLLHTSEGNYLREQLQNWLKLQTYQDEPVNNVEKLDEILQQISFENTSLDFEWQFHHTPFSLDNDRPGWLIWCSFKRIESVEGELGRGRGRDEIIWQGTKVSGVVKTAWLLIELLIRHELMEGFRWMGQRIFNPHNSVIDLAKLQIDHEASW